MGFGAKPQAGFRAAALTSPASKKSSPRAGRLAAYDWDGSVAQSPSRPANPSPYPPSPSPGSAQQTAMRSFLIYEATLRQRSGGLNAYMTPGNQPRGKFEGAAAPSNTIRSGGMYAARSNGTLLPVSLEVCPKGARTSDVFRPHRCKAAKQLCGGMRYGFSRFGPRKMNMASLMVMPSSSMVRRSTPRPKPPCGGQPYLKNSV